MSATLTVTQVNRFLKSLIDGDGRLSDIYIAGEISNFTQNARSGHMYFSLKDESSAIRAVMFANAAGRLRFRPEDGMRVIIRGRVSVYEPAGQYQLYAEDMQPDGVGALSLAFEQLKARLAAEGLFDRERKRTIPVCPMRIGLITSPTGAALQDMLNIIGRRWPICEAVLCGVQVQGAGAPGQLIAALKTLNLLEACDVIIIGRGGGSMEDLWAFNHEGLARAVAASKIPVISAVGHETDFTICDFAADLRAPTPSAAAELCTPDCQGLMDSIRSYNVYFHRKARDTLAYYRQSLDLLMGGSLLSDRGGYVKLRRDTVDGLTVRLDGAIKDKLSGCKNELVLAAAKLDVLSPLKALSRGYAVVYHEGKAVRDLSALPEGEEVLIQAEKGKRAAKLLENN